MKNKITVSIAGQTYTLVASEESGYMEKVAAHVDAKIQEVLDESKVSLVDGAVLKLKMELSEAKREIFKLQNKK